MARSVALVSSLLMACTAASGQNKELAVPPTVVAGQVEVDGTPRAGVEVVLVSAAGEALAFQSSDGRGRFSFPVAAFAGGWVLARLREPVLGAAAVQVRAPSPDVVLAVSSRSAATLQVDLQPPTGVAFDWADVHVTPRAIPGVPDEVVSVAGLVGIGPSRRASYHEVRVHQPSARLRLLPGLWSVTVAHIVEHSPTPRPPPPNWTSDVMTLPDGTHLPAQLRAHRVTVSGDLHVTVTSRVVKD